MEELVDKYRVMCHYDTELGTEIKNLQKMLACIEAEKKESQKALATVRDQIKKQADEDYRHFSYEDWDEELSKITNGESTRRTLLPTYMVVDYVANALLKKHNYNEEAFATFILANREKYTKVGFSNSRICSVLLRR